MHCPGCGVECHQFFSVSNNEGTHYACRNCESKAHPSVVLVARRKRNSSQLTRSYERFEVPKSERVNVKKMVSSRPRIQDTPESRNLVAVDSPKRRATIFEWGSSAKSDRNARAMKKLENKLGPNPKILMDDGFQILAEAAN